MDTSKNIARLIELGTVFEVAQGEALFSIYEEAASYKCLFVLLEGKCSLISTSSCGNECIFFNFDKGDVMGYIPFITHYYLNDVNPEQYVDDGLYQIVAQTNVKVLRIPRANCEKLIDDLGFQHMLITSIGKHMVSTSLVAQGSTVERLCAFLRKQIAPNDEGGMQLDPSLTYKKIANLLGIHAVTVGNIMRSLISEGTFRRLGRRLFLENENRLISLATGCERLKYY